MRSCCRSGRSSGFSEQAVAGSGARYPSGPRCRSRAAHRSGCGLRSGNSGPGSGYGTLRGINSCLVQQRFSVMGLNGPTTRFSVYSAFSSPSLRSMVPRLPGQRSQRHASRRSPRRAHTWSWPSSSLRKAAPVVRRLMTCSRGWSPTSRSRASPSWRWASTWITGTGSAGAIHSPRAQFSERQSAQSARSGSAPGIALTVTEASRSLGVSRKTLSSILNGRAGISPEMAVRLSLAFGTSAESWMNQQVQYDPLAC